jgi:hypothetical protein
LSRNRSAGNRVFMGYTSCTLYLVIVPPFEYGV